MNKNISTESIKHLENEITPVVAYATSIFVKNDKDMALAAEALSKVNKYADTVEEKREAITKPLNVALKASRALFKPLEDRLQASIDHIRKEMSRYQTEKVKVMREEEAKIAARVGEGKGKIKIETAVRKMGEVEKPVDELVAESGVVTFMEVLKFKVMDITLVPPEYLLVDEVKVRAALKAGAKVPGMDYWFEQVPKNYR
jgi:hypothetical protein